MKMVELGVPFFTISTRIAILYSIFPIPNYWLRAQKGFLAPAGMAAVQRVGSIILAKFVGLTIEVTDDGIADSICRPSYCLPKISGIVLLVQRCLRKAEDNIMSADIEFLDSCALGKESNARIRRGRCIHCSLMLKSWALWFSKCHLPSSKLKIEL